MIVQKKLAFNIEEFEIDTMKVEFTDFKGLISINFFAARAAAAPRRKVAMCFELMLILFCVNCFIQKYYIIP